jgi:hypothetical protein
MFVLASDTGNDLLWLAGQRAAIVTRDGRIVRAAGLGYDLSGLVTRQMATRLNSAQPAKFSWSADFPDLNVYSAQITCEDKPVGTDPITLLGKTINTLRIDETCESEVLGWSFTNYYWVSPSSGVVWRSLQHLHPKLDVVELSVLRPAT